MLDELIRQLRRDEGEVLHAYHDTEGWLTIGIGRLIDQKRGGGITREEATYLLGNDLQRVTRQLQERLPWCIRLSEPRFGVLMNMAFNLGIAGLLDFKRFLAALEQGDMPTAAAEMTASKWARQVGARADRLRKQLIEDRWQ